jgi:hypothetical protein
MRQKRLPPSARKRSPRVNPRSRRSRSANCSARRRSRASRCQWRHKRSSPRLFLCDAMRMSRGTARLLCLEGGEFLGERAGDAGPFRQTLEVVLHCWIRRHINAGKARPVQHRHQIRVGNGEAIQQELATLEMRVNIGQALWRFTARKLLRPFVAVRTEQRRKHQLVQFGRNEVQPLL